MTNTTTRVVANEDNYLELMHTLGALTVLKLACSIKSRLNELNYFYDGEDDGRWMEKPQYYPEFWVNAINRTLDETTFEIEE